MILISHGFTPTYLKFDKTIEKMLIVDKGGEKQRNKDMSDRGVFDIGGEI